VIKPYRVFLVLAATATGLALVASAAGRTSAGSTRTKHFKAPIEALSLSGSRIAYDLGTSFADRHGKIANRANQVLVWNLHSGATTKVSGKHTAGADDSGTGSGVLQLALAGTRVAWLVNQGGNTEGDDFLFSSSIASRKERQVATEQRLGDSCSGGPGVGNLHCAGTWLGGLVSSGSQILANRWTTDDSGSVTDGGLYALNGTKMKSVATGPDTVAATSADGSRVAVLRPSGIVAVYSTAGGSPLTVTPTPRARAVALSGRNLVVLEFGGTLGVFDSHTGALRKNFTLHGDSKLLQALAVHGNVAVYSKPVRFKTDAVSVGAIHAINLSTGKDRAVGTLNGAITLAEIGSAGLVYASNGYGAFKAGNGTLAFMPFARVAAAVS
jgi:hypothetical protein